MEIHGYSGTMTRWTKYLNFDFILMIRVCWHVRVVQTGLVCSLELFINSPDDVWAFFSLLVHVQLLGGEAFMSCDVILRLPYFSFDLFFFPQSDHSMLTVVVVQVWKAKILVQLTSSSVVPFVSLPFRELLFYCLLKTDILSYPINMLLSKCRDCPDEIRTSYDSFLHGVYKMRGFGQFS